MNNISTCYICDTPLISNVTNGVVNVSTEHIIPNALGGRLKSKLLLCNTCNKKFGDECDAELTKQFSSLTSLLLIERDRGDIPDVKGGKNSTGRYTIINGYKPVLASLLYSQEKISSDKLQISITARDEKEMRQKLKELAKKYPQIDVELAMTKTVSKSEFLKEPILFSFELGIPLTFVALTKIATNFYMHSGGRKAHIEHAISLFKGEQYNHQVTNYNPVEKPYREQEDEIVHILHIEGRPQESLLYCYIQLLSTAGYVIVLSRSYDGEKFNKTYAWDVLEKKELDMSLSFDFDREIIDRMFIVRGSEPDSLNMLNNLHRLHRIIDKRQNRKYEQVIFEAVCIELFGQKSFPEPVTKENVNIFTSKYYERILIWANSKLNPDFL